MAIGDEKDGRLLVKVIDFGVAKAITRGTDAMSLTHGGFVGTPALASPEQFARGPIDVRSDIYSLGVTLWYLLTGQMPFRGQTVEELREAQRTTPLPVEQLKAAHVPRRLVSLLESMLALAPAARPDTNTLSTRLKACGTQLTGRRKRALLFALIVASLAILFALLLSNPGKSSAKKSIAVLPFEDLSGDRENTNFVGGIQDDIVTNLSRIGQLKVIPRSSVLIYKATPHNVREIAQTLGVSTVLEGSVRRSGNRVRINVQLIDAANDEQI
jgi:TolB-like protein